MITRTDLFIFVVVLFLALLVGVAIYSMLRIRKASTATWSSLLDRLIEVDRNRIAVVALDLVDEEGRPREHGDSEIEPESMWDLVGGLDGLEILENNCEVLVELAAYVQRWHPEAVVVAEQLRLNAREIQWHVARLKGAEKDWESSHFLSYVRSTHRRMLLPHDQAPIGVVRTGQSLRVGPVASRSVAASYATRRMNTAATVPITSISFL